MKTIQSSVSKLLPAVYYWWFVRHTINYAGPCCVHAVVALNKMLGMLMLDIQQ